MPQHHTVSASVKHFSSALLKPWRGMFGSRCLSSMDLSLHNFAVYVHDNLPRQLCGIVMAEPFSIAAAAISLLAIAAKIGKPLTVFHDVKDAADDLKALKDDSIPQYLSSISSKTTRKPEPFRVFQPTQSKALPNHIQPRVHFQSLGTSDKTSMTGSARQKLAARL